MVKLFCGVSEATCLPADCFSVSKHYKNPTKHVGILQS